MQALRQQSMPAIQSLKTRGIMPTLSNLDVLVTPGPIEAVLRRLYQSVGTQSANDTYAYLSAASPDQMANKSTFGPNQFKLFGLNSFWRDIMNSFFSVFGAKNVRSITETERDRIRRELMAGQEQGLDNFAIAERLESPEIWRKRASVIARTEPAIAASKGADEAARRTGLQLVKTWLSGRDNRTRRIPRNSTDHYSMNNTTVQMDDLFAVPKVGGFDLMITPHAPGAPAAQVVQCRCRAIYTSFRSVLR